MGFAYDVFGNGLMSLRGGYGIGYERNFGNVTFNILQNPPNYAVISVTSGTDVAPGNLPIYTNNLGPLAGAGSTCGGNPNVLPGTSCFPTPSLRAVQQSIPTAYVQFWSFAIDYQVLKDSVLSFEYTGSKGTHEYDISNLNAGGYGSSFLGDARFNNRLNYQYSGINYRGANGFNSYNGLNMKFQSNNLFNKGLYLNANYTWSHAIDNLSSTFTEGSNGAYVQGYLDPYNANLDRPVRQRPEGGLKSVGRGQKRREHDGHDAANHHLRARQNPRLGAAGTLFRSAHIAFVDFDQAL